MKNTYRWVILLIELYCFIGLAGEQPRTAVVKGHGEDAVFGVDGSGLCCGLETLEVITWAPVPEKHATIVAWE